MGSWLCLSLVVLHLCTVAGIWGVNQLVEDALCLLNKYTLGLNEA